MKRIVVCDSGLGGLNIAARFFSQGPASSAPPCELIYFNAYPAPDRGFNTLGSARAREEVLRDVFEGIGRFSPDLCLIACNTLSIVWEGLKTWYAPAFPVAGIVDAAVGGLAGALAREPASSLLVLGTKSTVESGMYPARLAAAGIDPGRIRSLAAPGLATLLESDPAAPEVRARIADCAARAEGLFERRPAKLLLGLCCTHFGFAAPIWLDEFGRRFGAVALVNPNDLLGAPFAARSFAYHSRIDFFPGAREHMGAYFETAAPAIAAALRAARPEPGLFAFNG